MAKRSLKASPSGIVRAKQAFQRREWTQEYLASEVGLQTRQPIWKFFSGRPIERHLFIDICFRLDLDWEDIADRPRLDDPIDNPEPISDPNQQPSLPWVQQVQAQLEPVIQTQCGVLQTTIDLAQPLPLLQVYTDVYLLPHLSSQRWLEVEDLQPSPAHLRSGHGFPSGVSRIKAWEALATYPKLLILGQPGSGKTTLLQYLALQCLQGSVQGDRIPIFLPLRHLHNAATSALEAVIHQQWSEFGLTQDQSQTLLKQGKALLLLDGLDEVNPAEQDLLHYQIQKFADTYHQVLIVITSRLAAREHSFQGFARMEVADFDPSQITSFVHKWFVAMNPTAPEVGTARATQFLEQLQRRENQPILELAVTPILLHLACLVFQERGAFPKKRSQLYQSSLDILLVRWDSARGIQRQTGDSLFHLSLADRITLLSQMAATMFEQGRYFFDKAEVLPLIVAHLATHGDGNLDPETLWQAGEDILRTIACHHGLLIERARDVYSFSHLTFQEYLTARRSFINSLAPAPSESNGKSPAWLALSHHVLEPHWHEVIALTAELLPGADPLIEAMISQIEDLTTAPALQPLLHWAQRKAVVIDRSHPAAVRAFYLSLALGQGLDLASALDPHLAMDLPSDLALDRALMHLLSLAKALVIAPTIEQSLSLCFAFDLEQRFSIAAQFSQELQTLRDDLMTGTPNEPSLQVWCEEAGGPWLEQLRQTLITGRDVGHDWQLTPSQWEQMQGYYQANLFIMQCLSRGVRITPALQGKLTQRLLQIQV
ncbi:hypothetical protein BST81_20980 [Leptolyngbya sp. 'hensonii']|uniref:NACHT domain-containing protein n=1 Tax=Leptolyngbya sp. 'hensonii' TaxID=1922337 RepID=UPI00094FAF0E|nr:NACHT domain-containing NTPase [Leptolyngbya sp. 'hensonii']OLP16456.1 hypothetical protein BST81_20980 [Leptolyngbya sp. 'hensonii']